MILFLAGTSDARELAICLQQDGHSLVATVVTESAEQSLQEAGIATKVGRNTAQDMQEMIAEQGFTLIVDASHPFAEEASKNAMAAAEQTGIPYIRFERTRSDYENPLIHVVADYEEAAQLAAQKRGVIMLTTGSKTLQVFTKHLQGLPDTRVLARMLPRLDNMEKCAALGVAQRDIIAIQGPFSEELNRALYHQYGVTLMVTKESGKVGSVDEKLTAALACGIETILIARPKIAYGIAYDNYQAVQQHVCEILGGK